MYGIMSKFPIQVSGISYLTLSINKELVLVFWLEVFYLTVASLTEISVILLLVLFLIILQGSLGAIFGGKAFEHTTNSVELAIDSNSYAHNLSYLVLNKEYLKGHGIGSSYIMELYTDYGMIGVFLLSFLLGVLFIAMLQVAYRSRTILFALSLLILNNLFFMPRSSFSESFFNLFTMQFWGIVLVIIFVAKMLTKEN